MKKKIPFWFWLPFSIGLQIFYMIYLFQKTGQLLIVLLGMSTFIIFALVFHYKDYIKDFDHETLEYYQKQGEVLKAQHEASKNMYKYLIRFLPPYLILSILFFLLFNISFRTTSSFVLYSGTFGVLLLHGIHIIKINST